MQIQLLPLLSYVIISTFTPGPSNISTTSLAMQHGYQKSLNYQVGLALAVFLYMFVSGWISATLLRIFPLLEPILRYLGAAYILYLAYLIFNANYTFQEEKTQPLGSGAGFLLNALNPKLFVYAFTLFSAFLAPISGNVAWVALAALLLAAISFAATSTWALFGSAIKRFLHNSHGKTVVNLVLGLLLVYTAISLIGLV
ncbi:MAG: LysE family translocator [Caldilineaceae bacterium]